MRGPFNGGSGGQHNVHLRRRERRHDRLQGAPHHVLRLHELEHWRKTLLDFQVKTGWRSPPPNFDFLTKVNRCAILQALWWGWEGGDLSGWHGWSGYQTMQIHKRSWSIYKGNIFFSLPLHEFTQKWGIIPRSNYHMHDTISHFLYSCCGSKLN